MASFGDSKVTSRSVVHAALSAAVALGVTALMPLPAFAMKVVGEDGARVQVPRIRRPRPRGQGALRRIVRRHGVKARGELRMIQLGN